MNVKLIFLIVGLFSASLELTAQKKVKVWLDDSTAESKADTSLVKISQVTYRKVITVTYQPISKEFLQSEFEQIREQQRQVIENERQQREESTKRIAEAKMKLESAQAFYQAAAKELKWKEKQLDEKTEPTLSVREMRIEAFQKNPRKRE